MRRLILERPAEGPLKATVDRTSDETRRSWKQCIALVGRDEIQ